MLVIFFSIFICIIFIFYNKFYRVWLSQHIPGPMPIIGIGTTYPMLFNDISNVYNNLAKKYGRIYGMYEGITPRLVIGDPELIKQIGVQHFSEFTNRRIFETLQEVVDDMIGISMDDKWRRARKIISPTFTTAKIKRMVPLIEACIEREINLIAKIADKNEQLNLHDFWVSYANDLIVRCCFAIDINAYQKNNNEFLSHVAGFLSKPSVLAILIMPIISYVPTFVWKKLKLDILPRNSIDYFSKVTKELLQHRKENENKQIDFLQLLIESCEENKTSEENKSLVLSETEIIANSIVFLVSGNETLPSLLQWSIYLLAMNPDIQQDLYTEINSAFRQTQNIGVDEANKLPLLDAVICETLRMYPPETVVERSNRYDFELRERRLKIPARTIVTFVPYMIQHDPEYFPEPYTFKPERFMPENRETINPYTYIPFGVGPRNCIARRFGLVVAKLTLIHTLLKFKFVKSEKTINSPSFLKHTFFLLSKENIYVSVERRQ